MGTELLWYVAYGSNLLARRFMSYITGEYFEEFSRRHRGCPDKTPPHQIVSMTIPGKILFASHADHWQGMVAAFYDASDKLSQTKVRAYLITQDQFEHILAQECNVAHPVRIDLSALQQTGHQDIGNGSYYFNRLVYLGERDRHPLITFTSSDTNLISMEPGPAYKQVLIEGLMESHGLSQKEAKQYTDSAATAAMNQR